MTETLILAAVLIPCLIVAIVFHEVAHGWTALMLGDPTAKEQRRLSLNPIRHIDPVGTLLVPGALALMGAPIFGWAKPVPVNQRRLDNPRFGMMAVAAAGPGTNLLLAGLAAIVIGVTGMTEAIIAGEGGLVATVFTYFLLINIFLALFNMLPIPPFDGSHIVEGLLPRPRARAYGKFRPFGMLLFFALIALVWFAPDLRLFERVFYPPVEWALDRYLALASLL